MSETKTCTPITDDALLSRSDIGEHGHGEGEFVEATLARRLEYELGMANNKWELAHKSLAEFCEAFENRGETTSLREWNNRLVRAYENAKEILAGRLPYATPKS